MSVITLHFRSPRNAPACSVCGAKLTRQASRWWLANTWTDLRELFREAETNMPGETARPCGVLRAPQDGC